MMEPTREYLAAREVGRTRQEASHGATRVVIENYSDDAHLFGKSMIYLSVDNGETFTLLDWKTYWSSWWKKQGWEWPPHDVQIERLDDEGLHLSYYEALYDGPMDRKASYLFADKRWRLR
ncbi:hypothetical protein [Caenimonas koreensis]|uniref:hypothetical protein n=1 Tax=Caenimonas koreensis TaxID=367474 RepID=UPI003784B174